jgi:hypothetical protein
MPLHALSLAGRVRSPRASLESLATVASLHEYSRDA